MNLKTRLRKVRLIRWLDDWTDTPTGETASYGIILLFFVLWALYNMWVDQ